MPPVGFEPTISAGERPKTYALDRAATGTGAHGPYAYLFVSMNSNYFKLNSIKLTRAMGSGKTWSYCRFTNNRTHTRT